MRLCSSGHTPIQLTSGRQPGSVQADLNGPGQWIGWSLKLGPAGLAACLTVVWAHSTAAPLCLAGARCFCAGRCCASGIAWCTAGEGRGCWLHGANGVTGESSCGSGSGGHARGHAGGGATKASCCAASKVRIDKASRACSRLAANPHHQCGSRHAVAPCTLPNGRC